MIDGFTKRTLPRRNKLDQVVKSDKHALKIDTMSADSEIVMETESGISRILPVIFAQRKLLRVSVMLLRH